MKFRSLALVILSVTAIVRTNAAASHTHLVSADQNICPTAKYTSIQAAIDASSPGDIINVCPGVYDEQIVISKPVTVNGVTVNSLGIARLQPSVLVATGGGSDIAVVQVLNTDNVHLLNLGVDASRNTVSDCTPTLSAVHFLNSSGEIRNDSITGAKLTSPGACPTLLGNGYGVLLESTGAGSHSVLVQGNSIHDYSKEGVRAIGNDLTATVAGNVITGLGPAGGSFFQFGVFMLNGAAGLIKGNQITEGDCGTLNQIDCISARSEGVVLRAVGDGTVVDQNVITRAQSGIFINNANKARITNNIIGEISALDAIDAQGMSNSLLRNNSISNATPLGNQSCGIVEFPGMGSAGGTEGNNLIINTVVNDAWCGIAYVPTSTVVSSQFFNVQYTQFRIDVGPPQ
jgi:nitrous oxidase accessory protein NosD